MTESNHGVPRRALLTIGSFLGVSLVGARLPGLATTLERARIENLPVDWGNDYLLLDNPGIWQERPELGEKAVLDILGWGKFCEKTWAHYDATEGLPATQHINLNSWENNARTLVDELSRWGSLLDWASREKQTQVKPILELKYQEIVKYLQITLIASQRLQTHSVEEAYQAMTTLNSYTGPAIKRGNDLIDQYLSDDLTRLDVSTTWNYPWKDMADGQTINEYSPLVLGGQVSDTEGVCFSDVVADSNTIFRNNSEKSQLNGVPEQGMYSGLEPSVETEVSEIMQRLGLDRAFTSISWGGASSEGMVEQTQDGVIAYGAHEQELSWTEYQKNKFDWWQKIGHELTHVMKSRSQFLADKDAIKFTNHWLSIIRAFNPLRTLKDLFNDSDEIPGNDYYVNTLLGGNSRMGSQYGQAIVGFSDEFLAMTATIREHPYIIKDHFEYFRPEVFFDKLEQDLGQMTGLDKLLSKTLLDNRESINDSRRAFTLFKDIDYNGKYISTYVLPLILGHLVLYRPDLVEEAIAQDHNSATLLNFFKNFQERLSQYAERSLMGEEFLSMVVGTIISREAIGEDMGTLTGVEQDYQGMVEILKNNQLI